MKRRERNYSVCSPHRPPQPMTTSPRSSQTRYLPNYPWPSVWPRQQRLKRVLMYVLFLAALLDSDSWLRTSGTVDAGTRQRRSRTGLQPSHIGRGSLAVARGAWCRKWDIGPNWSVKEDQRVCSCSFHYKARVSWANVQFSSVVGGQHFPQQPEVPVRLRMLSYSLFTKICHHLFLLSLCFFFSPPQS